jgi:hypothetical protein
MMVHLYMTPEKLTAPAEFELLSANDIRDLLVHFLPRPNATTEDLIDRIMRRHERRDPKHRQRTI